ncbi:hypothetical protein BH11PSE13_BH11PSE13_25520 [soil metagenome]
MNRSFKSIWSEAQGAWVAVSELAAGRGKKASATTALLGFAVVAGIAFGGDAEAQVKIGANPGVINPGSIFEIEGNGGTLFTRIAVLDRNTWGLPGNAPVEGMTVYNTNATGGVNGLQKGLAVWKNSQWVSVDETPYFHVNSTANGNSTQANSGAIGAESLAAGPGATAKGTSTIAIGNGATAGVAADTGAIAIGLNANTSVTSFLTVPSGGAAVVIGANAISKGVNGSSSGGFVRPVVAVGADSEATGSGAVAVGANARADTGSVAVGVGAQRCLRWANGRRSWRRRVDCPWQYG